MKKSEHYYRAQLAVLRDDHITNVDKLEILHTLRGDEDVQKLVEKRQEEQEAAE